MVKKDLCIGFFAVFNEQTGYGIHASRFAEAMEKRNDVVFKRNQLGDINITLIDSVGIQNVNQRLPYPSICYNVWESTLQPQWFVDQYFKYFDYLWVPSEWQRACSIAQGIPEEQVFVVHEGVDPNIYNPLINKLPNEYVKPTPFKFLHVGQWQPRKSTMEIIKTFQRSFYYEEQVELQLSVDTLFPSDDYSSTEDRLEAYGLKDPRIKIIHFENRNDYIKRLKEADCFVSCARAEGWGLPIIEAMACGVPTIVCDWSGSTEYAENAIKVPVKELIKPYGIYGNWDVPGQWAEPDFEVLLSSMRLVYNNSCFMKQKAIEESENIRENFSWDKAADKAVFLCKAIYYNNDKEINAISEIKKFARERGFEIKELDELQKRNAIFVIDCHPSSQERIDTLIETINQVKKYGYPILLTTHLSLPSVVVDMVDYHIYDKRDILSPESDMPVYWRTDGRTQESIKSNIPCHALAATHNICNAINFCKGKFDWIYQVTSDVEVNMDMWIKSVESSDKDLIGTTWDGQGETFGGQLVAGKIEVLEKINHDFNTWEEFAAYHGDDRFCVERSTYRDVKKNVGLNNVELVRIELGNRFDQVDREAWPDDMFIMNYIDGPTFHINGISKREYQVVFSNDIEGTNHYSLIQKVGMWSKPRIKFFRNWEVKAYLDGELKYEHKLNFEGQRILIGMGSKALGDTLAWMPYVEEFRKKHNCHVICSSWWNDIFDYPEIEFVLPGSKVENIYGTFEIGCFDGQSDKNPFDWRTVPLQKVAADILGIEYEPIRAKLIKHNPSNMIQQHYVCFSEFSTMQNKFWNHEGGWQNVINYLISKDYKCISISKESSDLINIEKHNNQTIEQTIADMQYCDFYIGLNHGPMWLAYSLGIPYILIDGVAEEWNNPPGAYRIKVDVGCKPCFNNTEIPIDRGWNWCVNEEKYKCTKAITPDMVIETINNVIEDNKNARKNSEN